MDLKNHQERASKMDGQVKALVQKPDDPSPDILGIHRVEGENRLLKAVL